MSDLDCAALSEALSRVMAGFPAIDQIERFPGGQSNPTYRLKAGGNDYVVRRQPFGELLPSAHAVDREYRVQLALQDACFPVARQKFLCRDKSRLGALFYLMEWVDGRTFWDGMLPEIPKQDRRAHYEALVDTLAQLHSLNPEALGLEDFGSHSSYCARQVARWSKQYRSSQTSDIPEVEWLIDWLPLTVPKQSCVSVIHGDFRIDNVIFARNEARVAAVIDWELSTLGDPIADFAYFALSWILPQDGRAGLAGADLTEAGIPDLEEITARYCHATGRGGLPDLHWYFAYNLFRLVGIVQGIRKRMLDGNASSQDAGRVAALVEPYAKLAWEQALLAGAPPKEMVSG